MSYVKAKDPHCANAEGSIALTIVPRERDLGEFTVRRVLPAGKRQMVGPFIFFDHMGPAEFPPDRGIQVRPHPHIGIATVTYLFDGEIMHRDSLGYSIAIQPGAVNLMTAGRGIVHSERAGDDFNRTSSLHGIQSWMALPDGEEECEPSFVHYPAADLPEIVRDGMHVRVIMGQAYGKQSPIATLSSTLYLDMQLNRGADAMLPDDYAELAAYVVSGSVRIDERDYAGGTMLVAAPGKTLVIEALEDCRVMVIGGDAVGPRQIWWNFVSRSTERMEQAKLDWKEGRFGKVPGDDEFIPLPD
jgi:redox-sensitive bicupin YhaK (pirin superfamily)